jgi:hypothetical protein
MARPATDPARVAQALALVATGETPAYAAEQTGVSHSVIKRALRAVALAPPPAKVHRKGGGKAPREAAAPTPSPAQAPGRVLPPAAPRQQAAAPPPPTAPGIDAQGDPLAIMRELLASATAALAGLPPDSPRLNPARAEARALTKAIAALEKERASVETPEEVVRRRRREDGETRQRIERYVLEHEEEAAAKGVCVHCGAPRAA